jgi:hypothetical protein
MSAAATAAVHNNDGSVWSPATRVTDNRRTSTDINVHKYSHTPPVTQQKHRRHKHDVLLHARNFKTTTQHMEARTLLFDSAEDSACTFFFWACFPARFFNPIIKHLFVVHVNFWRTL